MSEHVVLHVYRVARNKDHGSGRAPKREAAMLAIMGFYIVKYKHRIWEPLLRKLMPTLLRLLYVRKSPCTNCGRSKEEHGNG